MKRYEVFQDKDDVGMRVYAPTKAGLAVTAVRGLFAAAGIVLDANADEVQREFSVQETDIAMLLKILLNEAWLQSKRNGESYGDVKFTLFTDKKATGAFVGGKARAPVVMPTVASVSEVVKNDEGEWETTVTFA